MHRPVDVLSESCCAHVPSLKKVRTARILRALSTAAAFVALAATGSGSLLAADPVPSSSNAVPKRQQPPSPVLLRRVPWTTSRVIGSPEPPHPYRLERAFPHHKFHNPVYLTPEPGTDRLLVVEYSDATVRAIKDDPNSKEESVILQFPAGKEKKAEIFSLVFHPNYQQNRLVYIFGNIRNLKGPRDEHNEIVRFRVSSKAPFVILPESGEVIIKWASAGHDGGDMGFGNDGYLYITAGDGTTGSDPDITGQDLTDLRASMLRIDVDHPSNGKPYGIPKDNPFLHIANARPEIYAFGLRALGG